MTSRLRTPLAVLSAVASGLLLAACSSSSSTDLAAIRAEVSSLSTPDAWVRDGDVQHACDGINLDCTNTSSWLTLRSTAPTADACAGLVTWVTTSDAFVSPTAVVGLTTATTPTASDCTSEMTSRGRYLIKAGARSSVSTSSSLGWQVLATRDAQGGARLSVVLGDPPQPVPGSGA